MSAEDSRVLRDERETAVYVYMQVQPASSGTASAPSRIYEWMLDPFRTDSNLPDEVNPRRTFHTDPGSGAFHQ